MPAPRSRHRRGAFPLGRIFGLVIGLHALVGGGVYWLLKTQSGQEFARVYQIKLFEPPKPPEPEQAEPPPPPPPPPAVEPPPVETVKAEAPPIAAPAAAAAPAPTVGGGGGSGTNWNGKFAGGGAFDGPEGAFHAAVTGRFREHYREPSESFGAAELELSVRGDGGVGAYKLVKSSGSPANDQAILRAAAAVQQEGIGKHPPEERGRIVTVRFVPSS